MEPLRKIKKTEDHELKAMIGVIQDMICNKLQSMEEKIEKISSKYVLLEKKVDLILSNVQNNPVSSTNDFCNGSWLGDPDNPELRVRCPIAPKYLEYINNHCTSAEKMSLMLLDYLFPREVQACSNISGLGKHKKNQLDPYKIKGIKYHVMYKFGISECDWERIKLNIDSKCRTAFRRKIKGLPINVRGKKGRPFYKITNETDESNECDLSPVPQTFNLADIFNQSDEMKSEENSFSEGLTEQIDSVNSFTLPLSTNSEITDSEEHKFTVIETTEEQLEMLKQDPSIKIIQEPPSQ